MKRFAVWLRNLSCVLVLGASPVAMADTVVVGPSGVYATIDTRLTVEAMAAINSGDAAAARAAIEAFAAAPERYAPPMFYLVSNVLMQADMPEPAMFWFYAGQLRATIDAALCLDASAREARSVLNERYGGIINRYAFAHLDQLKQIVPKVVAWDKATSRAYDQRWINLHGMAAMRSALGDGSTPALSLPASEWDAVIANTRDEYLRSFQAGMVTLEQRASGAAAPVQP